MPRPRCGNDPRAQLTPGDRQAIADFRAYLTRRAQEKTMTEQAIADRDRIAETLARADGWEWAAASFSTLSTPAADRYRRLAEAVLAVLPPPATRADVLTDAERTMLTYALDQAQEHIWSRDGFTEEDQAAVSSLRRLTAEAQQGEAQP